MLNILVSGTPIQGGKFIIENANASTFQEMLNVVRAELPALASFDTYHISGKYAENGVVTLYSIKLGETVLAGERTMFELSDSLPLVDRIVLTLSPVKMDGGIQLSQEEKDYILNKSTSSKSPIASNPTNKVTNKVTFEDLKVEDWGGTYDNSDEIGEDGCEETYYGIEENDIDIDDWLNS